MLRPWKMTLGRIDPALKTPLYLQIVRAIIHEIERGRLPPQAFLPSSRELATILGVNRKTVVLAYEDLIAQVATTDCNIAIRAARPGCARRWR
jgi:GntR family transcriptional regulator/MocR family aminotransferase